MPFTLIVTTYEEKLVLSGVYPHPPPTHKHHMDRLNALHGPIYQKRLALPAGGVSGVTWPLWETSSTLGLRHAPSALWDLCDCPAQWWLESPTSSGPSRPAQTHRGPVPTFQGGHGPPVHSQKGLSHSVVCRSMPWGGEGDKSSCCQHWGHVVPPPIPAHSETALCYISWEIHVLLNLPNYSSPDITPVMDGLGYESTWPKHILQSQIFPSVQNKHACQKLQTHNSNLLTLVKDKDTEQLVFLDSLVSCVTFTIVF